MNKFVFAAVSALALAVPARAETLTDAIDAAYRANPQLAAARARQDALEETPEQARSAGRLTASVDSGAGYDKFGYKPGGYASASAEQPVWTGGRVSSSVRAANGDVAAGAEGLRDTEAEILSQVIGAYAELLYDQQSVAIAQADIELLDNQVRESQSRFNLGQSTKTDVARLEAQRASAGATLADAQATLANTAAAYRALVGHDPATLAPPPATLGTLPATLDAAREAVLARNPLYRQSQAAAGAAAARIDQARANGNPSLSIAGTYGYDFNFARNVDDRSTPRSATIGLALHVPVLTGGLVASQVRQAQANSRAARFDIDSAEREAMRQAESAWANLNGAQRRTEANRAGVSAAELALKGVRAEYGYDLRSTLDILVADESLRAAQLSLARSQSDLLVAQAALLRAAGNLDRDTLVASR